MKLKQTSIILFASLCLMAPGAVAKTIKPVTAEEAKVSLNESENTVNVALTYNLKDLKLGGNQEVILTPAIISNDGKDSVMLKSITVCGRNRWYWYQRNGKAENPYNDIYRAGKNEIVSLTETVPMQDWMGKSTIEVVMREATCCSAPKKVAGESANGNTLIATINTGRPDIDFDYVFAPQLSDAPVEMALEGSAFVNFVVNRTELNPDYMINRQEINKILASIDKVRNDYDAIITNIHIKGFASPEGTYQNNTRLAQGRTETLAKYVNDLYKFNPGTISTSYEPEDWTGLRNYVKDSLNYNIEHRAEILEIIDGPLGFDAKDQTIKSRYPKDYQVILKEIYPWLRHSDYKVAYKIKVYTDINDLKRLYANEPVKLRPVDFYTLAQQYPEGSKEFLAVMKKASEVYPDDPMINLNVANLYMMEGDLEAAQGALLKAGLTPQAHFARGVLAAKRGDLKDAEKFFKLAESEGITKASEYLNQIEKQKEYQPVIMVKQ